ncbi:MAG: hypothetical protein Ct9H300mP23_10610 [Nitrospinota bacterium]|nr:MAG: hypothetical protein Ct9H300mP23_10610 [Nitrospinota bacterium]
MDLLGVGISVMPQLENYVKPKVMILWIDQATLGLQSEELRTVSLERQLMSVQCLLLVKSSFENFLI